MHQSRSYRKLIKPLVLRDPDVFLLTPNYSPENGSLWYYAPDKGAPIVFALLFAISEIVHLYQTWYVHRKCPMLTIIVSLHHQLQAPAKNHSVIRKYKSWKVTGLLPWSALLFAAGLGRDAIYWSLWPVGQYRGIHCKYSATSRCTVILSMRSPTTLFSAGFCTTFHTTRRFTLVVSSPLLTVSAVIEASTANGAAQVAGADSSPTSVSTGKALLKAALLLHIILMVAFVTMAGRFHYNCVKNRVFNRKIRRALIVLYISSTLITTRTIYRTVGFFSTASLKTSALEWYFCVFEAVLMFCNRILLNAFHPMHSLPLSNTVYLAEDGVSEIEGPGYKDPRRLIMTFIDPFDICGLILRRDRHAKYWESGSADGTVSPCAGAKV
ncbi:hypothetical protein N7539_001681 [Penicillium diatomitis]|uniref:Uncharacterized protein n=1 Tax=Penicillium diatomitis TaxID=2819901 RepID=A0A9W9XI36_9EURO|nr:uncharacterized protein N7539_001681 [Penicillium diatomitis]KAJ5492935.1 hypothetical protein N7539_001681 [Penicillium diatomitis]